MTSPDSAAWLEAQVAEYTRLLPAYERLATRLDRTLRETAGRLAPVAIVQTRAKSIASFAEKSLRKRDKYVMPAHQLTDLCGARVIVRTLDELRRTSTEVEATFDVDWENSLDVARRLPSSQFGYRSVHYVVSLRPDAPLDDADTDLLGFDCPDCGVRHALKAEVQLRTTVQHAWADFAHDLTYKGAVPLPEALEREVAVIAAELEDVDHAFERIDAELRTYAGGAGSHLTGQQLEQERALLDTIRAHAPHDRQLAARTARLSLRLGDWDRATDVLRPFVEDGGSGGDVAALARDLGTARCQQHRRTPESAGYREGRRLLERAVALAPDDGEALTALAGAWRGTDDQRARELYVRAVERDPGDYRALGQLVELSIERGGSTAMTLLRPLLVPAMERCRAHLRLGVNLPWALFELGRFHLLRDEAYDSLRAYALGLRSTTAPFMIEEALASLAAVSPDGEGPGPAEWARRLLMIGMASHVGGAAPTGAVAELATPAVGALPEPVVIVAGGTHPREEEHLGSYLDLLTEGFRGFEGTVLAGGTREGISGLIGAVRAEPGARFQLVGYLPRELPDDATPDERYDELRRTTAPSFSPLEVLQGWIDLVATGIDPARVRLLGINGGPIASAEYHIAAALGATVGLVEDSRREASRLLADTPWLLSDSIVPLPADADTVRAFVHGGDDHTLAADIVEVLARAAHRAYLREATTATTTDPSLRDWEHLSEDLRASNRDQARHYAFLLAEIGCTIAGIGGDDAPRTAFAPEEVERMAAAEHGRWATERLLGGWRWAPEKDVERQRSPYLVPWERLTEEVKELDRAVVRRMPDLLAEAGLEVRRSTERAPAR